MPFVFSDPGTERVDFSKVLAPLSAELTPKYLKTLTELRGKVSETFASQPSSEALMEAIEAYIPHMLLLMELNDQERLPKIDFAWKAVLTVGTVSGIRSKKSEKKIFKCASIYYEAIYLMLAYALSLANMALKKVGQQPSIASETALNEAVDLYCRSSGICFFLARGWASNWTDPASKNKPPECTVTALQAIAEFMLLEAQILGTVKAEKRGMSVNTLMKLQRCCSEKFTSIRTMLGNARSATGELSDSFLSYIKEGGELYEALLMKKYAALCHGEDKNGMAVACMTKCYNLMMVDLKKVTSPTWAKLHADNKDDVKMLLDQYVRMNNHVTYEPIPNDHDVMAAIPQAHCLVESKPYDLPATAAIPSADTDSLNMDVDASKKTGFLSGLFRVSKDDVQPGA